MFFFLVTETVPDSESLVEAPKRQSKHSTTIPLPKAFFVLFRFCFYSSIKTRKVRNIMRCHKETNTLVDVFTRAGMLSNFT